MKLKKFLKVSAIVLLVVVIVGVVGVSVVTGKMVADGLFYQNAGKDTKQASIKQLEIWGFDFDEFKKNYVGEDFYLKASDGVTFPATLYKAEESDSTVVLVHGAGGDRFSIVPVAKLYLENGWNVLIYDQRGCGDNSDDKVSFGYFEAKDVEAVVDYAVNNLKSEKVVVHGQSMGGATAGLYAVTKHAKENVYAIIMDSPVHSMEYMFRGVFSQMEGAEDIPTDYVVTCGDWYMKMFCGMSFADAETVERMKENQVKTMVILSERDNLCLPDEVSRLYNNIAATDKKLISVDSEHIKGAIDDPEGYISQVMEFIGE